MKSLALDHLFIVAAPQRKRRTLLRSNQITVVYRTCGAVLPPPLAYDAMQARVSDFEANQWKFIFHKSRPIKIRSRIEMVLVNHERLSVKVQDIS